MSNKKTTVGSVNKQVLEYTAGRDIELDRLLIDVDCIATAAHVKMLEQIPCDVPILSKVECDKIINSLNEIRVQKDKGKFKIRLSDQDVHLAIERVLTLELGDTGKRIHTGRSRNDQVAVDLRLYGKEQLLLILSELTDLIKVLIKFGKRYQLVPMVGRTHMQPGMPSSVGLWASAHAESLLDDAKLIFHILEVNDQCPLGSAASYGVPLPINRELTAALLGFSRVTHNVLYANNSRGKIESMVLSGMSQIMLTLSRLAQDLIIFTMPEFNYFILPDSFCTGSSIMPQKNNPDVCELVRAKSSRVKAAELMVYDIVKASPSGYNRDLQEAKEPFIDGISITRSSLTIMSAMLDATKINKGNLIQGFTKDVFATDFALELVADGVPFRDAYQSVKENLDSLSKINPIEAVQKKTHTGAPLGLNWKRYQEQLLEVNKNTKKIKRSYEKSITSLMGIPYEVR